MALTSPMGFEIQAPEPIDNRTLKSTIEERDSIPYVVRYEGLSVYVTATNTDYQLVGGITNDNWTSEADFYVKKAGDTMTGTLIVYDSNNSNYYTEYTKSGLSSYYDGSTDNKLDVKFDSTEDGLVVRGYDDEGLLGTSLILKREATATLTASGTLWTMDGNMSINTSGSQHLNLTQDGNIHGSLWHSDTTNQVVLTRYNSSGNVESQLTLGSQGVSIAGPSGGAPIISNDQDITTKTYVDNAIDGKVSTSGDTMTGTLTVADSANPTDHFAEYSKKGILIQSRPENEADLDEAVKFSLTAQSEGYSDYFTLTNSDTAGDTFTHIKIDSANLATLSGTGDNWYIDNNKILTSNDFDSADYVKKAGDTMTGSLGIGTDSPAEALDVAGNIKSSGNISATGLTTQTGTFSSYVYTGGYEDSYLAYIYTKLYKDKLTLIYDDDTRTDEWSIKGNTDTLDISYVGSGDDGDASYTAIHADGANNRLGIGTTSPAEALHVVGNIVATGTITQNYSSDIRFKDNVKPLTAELEKVLLLKPVSFEWNDLARKYSSANEGEDIGLIAQEVEKIYPDLVHDMYEKYKGIDYAKLSVHLLGALQEEHEKLKSIEARLEKLEQAL